MINDFISLIFPRVCQACGRALHHKEECICTYCFYRLPRTRYHLFPDNPVSRLFWGRIPVVSASSMYLFVKGGKVQQLIHRLKYRGRQDIGTVLGRNYGNELRTVPVFDPISYVVPVPLHPDKQKRRGYNQAEKFADGLGHGLGIPVLPVALSRKHASSTQTRKGRYDRWENIRDSFYVSDPAGLAGAHVLLADDVITTGATLEACARILLELPGTRVSVATIAYAENR